MGVKNERSLKKNITRVLAANFWVALIGFVGSFVFPKILTIESYALYHTFTLYVGYIAICHLGFSSGMVINYAGKDYNDISRPRYKSEVKVLFTILLTFSLIFIVFSIISWNRMVFYIALAVFPVGIVGSYNSLYQAWGRFKDYSRISTFISTSIPLTALLYYIIVKDLPGNIYIIIYLLAYWTVTSVIIFEVFKKVFRTKSDKMFSKENFNTEKTGIAIVVGNYINTLFVSADKQFVSWFFDENKFAYYSFGMSMQALMTVFITSIAQPLFPAMAQGKFKDNEYKNIKHCLLVFGSMSGCAYFVASFIVRHFIQKYIPSLKIVGIYFSVFPAMAVINCLYINLYKIKNKMKTYVITLGSILGVSIVLNTAGVLLLKNFIGVAIATTITYYIWLFIGSIQFDFLRMSMKEMLYILVYLIGFFGITSMKSDLIGLSFYTAFLIFISILFFKNDLLMLVDRLKRR